MCPPPPPPITLTLLRNRHDTNYTHLKRRLKSYFGRWNKIHIIYTQVCYLVSFLMKNGVCHTGFAKKGCRTTTLYTIAKQVKGVITTQVLPKHWCNWMKVSSYPPLQPEPRSCRQGYRNPWYCTSYSKIENVSSVTVFFFFWCNCPLKELVFLGHTRQQRNSEKTSVYSILSYDQNSSA